MRAACSGILGGMWASTSFWIFFIFCQQYHHIFAPKFTPSFLLHLDNIPLQACFHCIAFITCSLLAMWGGSGIVCDLSKKRRGFLSGEICTWWHCWSIWINLVENLATFWYWGRQEMYLQDIRQSLKMFKKLRYQDSIKYDLIFSLSVPLVLYLSRLLWTMLTAS